MIRLHIRLRISQIRHRRRSLARKALRRDTQTRQNQLIPDWRVNANINTSTNHIVHVGRIVVRVTGNLHGERVFDGVLTVELLGWLSSFREEFEDAPSTCQTE
jgi:hypothetical protein